MLLSELCDFGTNTILMTSTSSAGCSPFCRGTLNDSGPRLLDVRLWRIAFVLRAWLTDNAKAVHPSSFEKHLARKPS